MKLLMPLPLLIRLKNCKTSSKAKANYFPQGEGICLCGFAKKGKTMVFETNSPEQTEALGAKLAQQLRPGTVIAYTGDLGAGKTAFTRGMGAALCPGEPVSSPTYAIVNEYIGDTCRICHFDMYRITDDEDLYSIGFYDYEDCIIVCEWSENIEYALPECYYKVTIRKKDENTREITIEEIR